MDRGGERNVLGAGSVAANPLRTAKIARSNIQGNRNARRHPAGIFGVKWPMAKREST
jgi:hypothetical protein